MPTPLVPRKQTVCRGSSSARRSPRPFPLRALVTMTAAFPAVGAFPLRSPSDAALLNPLSPGSYTLQAGAAPLPPQPPANFVPPNATGSVLVEVYELP